MRGRVKVVVLALVAALNALVGPGAAGRSRRRPTPLTRAARRQQDRLRELQARHRPGRLGHQRRGRRLHPGLRDRHLGQRRPAHRLQDRHRRLGLHDRHLPDRLLPGPRRAQDRLGDAERLAAAEPAQLHHRRHHRALRLRQLGASRRRGTCRPRPSPASTSPTSSAATATPATSPSSSATTPAPPTSSSRPPTRRGRPTTPTAARTSTGGGANGRAYKVSYNRPVLHPRRRPAVATSTSPTSTPMVRFLERNGYDVSLHGRRRHRPPRQPASRTTRSSSPSATTSTGAAPSAPTSRRPATPA